MSPALQVRTPEPISPMQTIGGLMQMRGQMADFALKQAEAERARQQTADIEAQSQQRQRDLESNRRLQEVLANPQNHAAFAAGDFTPIHKAGVSPNIAMPAITSLQSMREKALTLDKEQAGRYAEGRGLLAKTIEGLDPDDAIAAEQFNGAIPILAKQHPELAAQLKPLAPGPTFRKDLKTLAGNNSVAFQMLSDAAGLEKEKAAAAESSALAGLHKAQTPGAEATSEVERLKADAMKNFQANPQAGASQIDAILPPATDAPANAAYKAAFQSAMQSGGPEAALHVINAAAAHAGQIAMSVNPQVRQAHVDTAVATEKATEPIKIHQAVQTQTLLNAGSGAALASVPPHLITHATTEYAKAGKEYADKVAAAQQLQDFIAAAQSGNKAAPGLIPIAEVRGLVSRVNRQELESVSSSAGSAADRIQGFFGKWTEGQPIPPAILNDTKAIADAMQHSARRGYEYQVQNVNHSYGSKFDPVKLDAPGGTPEISTQADYDKLPKGAQYTNNGVLHVKQ